MWENLIGARSNSVANTIERGAVRRFAEAIGDRNPLYLDEEAARNSRYGRLLAPPTFPVTLDYGPIDGLELPAGGLIHGQQRFTYHRPLFVGDHILCFTTLVQSYQKRGSSGLMHFLVLKRDGQDEQDAPVFSMSATLIITEAVMREIRR